MPLIIFLSLIGQKKRAVVSQPVRFPISFSPLSSLGLPLGLCRNHNWGIQCVEVSWYHNWYRPLSWRALEHRGLAGDHGALSRVFVLVEGAFLLLIIDFHTA